MTVRNFDDIIKDLKELEKENCEIPFIHHCKAGLFLEAYSMLEAFIRAEFPQIIDPVPKLYKILTHERVFIELYSKEKLFIKWLLETLNSPDENTSNDLIEKARQRYGIPLTLFKGAGSQDLTEHIQSCGCLNFKPKPHIISDYDAAITLRNKICHSDFDSIKTISIDSIIGYVKCYKEVCQIAKKAKESIPRRSVLAS
jgi:hypothetical protein